MAFCDNRVKESIKVLAANLELTCTPDRDAISLEVGEQQSSWFQMEDTSGPEVLEGLNGNDGECQARVNLHCTRDFFDFYCHMYLLFGQKADAVDWVD